MKSYKNNKVVFTIKPIQIILVLLVLLVIIGCVYFKIIKTKTVNYKLSKQTEKFVLDNDQSVFKVDKVMLYSSAGTVDNTDEEVLQDMNISQFTDISVSINNRNKVEDITDENTVKEIYIDNINVENNSNIGQKIVNYKNPYLLGKFVMLNNCANNRIDYRVLNTNKENNDANYDEANFYTDCSNPLSLCYINKDMVKNYGVSVNRNSIKFDGSILKDAGISTDDIETKISFQIHLKNYRNEEFVCPVVINTNLGEDKETIYNGFTVLLDDNNNEGYDFIQVK